MQSILSSLLFSGALVLDTLVSGFAYGVSKIKIPLLSAVIIDVISTTLLAASLLIGKIVAPFLPQRAAVWISFSLLLLLGVIKLLSLPIKLILNRLTLKPLCVKISGSRYIIEILKDSTAADQNADKILSIKESVHLSIALSLDGLGAGFGAGVGGSGIYFIILFSAVLGFASILIGTLIGLKVAKKTGLNLSWLGGIMLIVIAVLKLF